MVNKLFATCRYWGAIATIFLLLDPLDCRATEYVFTAPPEVDREVVEIPASDTEYPLYECQGETDADSESVLDSHQCTCVDCDRSEAEITEPSTADAEQNTDSEP